MSGPGERAPGRKLGEVCLDGGGAACSDATGGAIRHFGRLRSSLHAILLPNIRFPLPVRAKRLTLGGRHRVSGECRMRWVSKMFQSGEINRRGKALIPAFYMGVLSSIIFNLPLAKVFAMEVRRGNLDYLAMTWQELPMGNVLSDDAAQRGKRIVTTVTSPICDAWLGADPKFKFRGFSPNGGWYENINMFPKSLSKPGQPFPTDGLGRPWAGSISPFGVDIDAQSWRSIPGFNQAVMSCEKYVLDQFGSSLAPYPGFLVFGVIERQGSYNTLIVKDIEFANYGNGFWGSLKNTAREDRYANLMLYLLRQQLGSGR